MDLNRLGRGQLGNAFARVAGLDDLNAVGTMAPEIMPVLSINERLEYWAMAGGKLGTCQFALGAGGAGVTGYAFLDNLANSGMMAVIEDLYIATAILVSWAIIPVGVAGAAIDVTVRDTRNAEIGDAQNGLGLKAYGDTSGGGGALTAAGGHTGINIVPLNIVLTPGWRLFFIPPVNSAFNLTVTWRERPLGLVEGRA